VNRGYQGSKSEAKLWVELNFALLKIGEQALRNVSGTLAQLRHVEHAARDRLLDVSIEPLRKPDGASRRDGSANDFKDLSENLQRHKSPTKYGPGIKWRPTIGPL
jgi:hypothetical protein